MRDYYRNKHLLGELTLKDLLQIAEVEGEYTLGNNWLPICRTRVSRKGEIHIFMDNSSIDSDISLSLDTIVKVAGRVVSMRVPWGGFPSGREIRLRLEREPIFL